MNSAIYVARVTHTRRAPFHHHLAYPLFYLWVDLDELPTLTLFGFSYNRFNFLSVFNRHHGAMKKNIPIKEWAMNCLATGNIDIRDGKIFMLACPSILGGVFNPLTVYYCYDANGQWRAMIYEVRNTFGEHQHYVIPIHAQTNTIVQKCAKAFYVSPFMENSGTYSFRLNNPRQTGQDKLSLAIDYENNAGQALIATLSGQRLDFTTKNLWKSLARHPFMTIAIVFFIHVHGLLLWLKGRRFYPHTRKTTNAVIYVDEI